MKKMEEILVQCLGREESLVKQMATPVFLPGESHGQGSLAGYSPWHLKESDMIEVTKHTHKAHTIPPFSSVYILLVNCFKHADSKNGIIPILQV